MLTQNLKQFNSLKDNFSKMPLSARKKLTLENDLLRIYKELNSLKDNSNEMPLSARKTNTHL